MCISWGAEEYGLMGSDEWAEVSKQLEWSLGGRGRGRRNRGASFEGFG